MIDKKIITEALKFYAIDYNYYDECYACLEEINASPKLLQAVKHLYNRLYTVDFIEAKKLWDYREIDDLIGMKTQHFLTNIMILLGYSLHRDNMDRLHFPDMQKAIHKNRVKSCFEDDLKKRGYKSIRVSQMIWASYFIRARIIEVGSLQFEYESSNIVKIHIPKGTNLSKSHVLSSLKESKQLIKDILSLNQYKLVCHSWLLSKDIHKLLNKGTNIYDFYNLFDTIEGDECQEDILDYIYELKECTDYALLPTHTSLQRKVKEELLHGHTFHLGLGTLKQEEDN